MQNQIDAISEDSPSGKGEKSDLPYFVNLKKGETDNRRALTLLISTRKCYMCQQADQEDPSNSSDVKEHINRIAKHCGQSSDYLPPDTPLKESIFRVLLAGGNKPMNAEEIGQTLSEQWALSAYPRDTSPRVIQRLLDNGSFYGISPGPKTKTRKKAKKRESPH